MYSSFPPGHGPSYPTTYHSNKTSAERNPTQSNATHLSGPLSFLPTPISVSSNTSASPRALALGHNSYNSPEKMEEALTRLQEVAAQMGSTEAFDKKAAQLLFYALNGHPSASSQTLDNFKPFISAYTVDSSVSMKQGVGLIAKSQEEDKPVTDYYTISDNSGSMTEAGSLLTIPPEDVERIKELREELSKSPHFSSSVFQQIYTPTPGKPSVFRASRIEEQFLKELNNFRLVKAALGERLAGEKDYDEMSCALKSDARQKNKLAYYSVPLWVVNDDQRFSENCTTSTSAKPVESNNSDVQYKLLKKIPIYSEKALLDTYKKHYKRLGTTPLASVTNAVVSDIGQLCGPDSSRRAIVNLKSDGAEYSSRNRKPYEVINELLIAVNKGIKVSLHPMTGEFDNLLSEMSKKSFLDAMQHMQTHMAAEQKDMAKKKEQLKENHGRVGTSAFPYEGNGVDWMNFADFITEPGSVDTNDDHDTESMQSMQAAIFSLPIETREDYEKAKVFWTRFCKIVDQSEQLATISLSNVNKDNAINRYLTKHYLEPRAALYQDIAHNSRINPLTDSRSIENTESAVAAIFSFPDFGKAKSLWAELSESENQFQYFSEALLSPENKGIDRDLTQSPVTEDTLNQLPFTAKQGIAVLLNREALTTLYNDITAHSPKIDDAFSISPFVKACKGAVVTQHFDKGDELSANMLLSKITKCKKYESMPVVPNAPAPIINSPAQPPGYSQSIVLDPFLQTKKKRDKVKEFLNWKF